eukprot:8387297-Karenia_brevis.AAC.1
MNLLDIAVLGMGPSGSREGSIVGTGVVEVEKGSAACSIPLHCQCQNDIPSPPLHSERKPPFGLLWTAGQAWLRQQLLLVQSSLPA